MAKVMGHDKDVKMMQGALAAILQRTDKDPEAAKEAKQEEKSWGGLLKNWGISTSRTRVLGFCISRWREHTKVSRGLRNEKLERS